MLIYTQDQHIEFLRTRIIKDVRNVIDNNDTVFGFMLISQAIEVMGAYLDDKPLRAKQQSAKRFRLAINRLFPGKYYHANQADFLYIQLRTCLTHMFIPSSKVELHNGFGTKEKPHLSNSTGVMLLFLEDFYLDLTYAEKNLENRIINKEIQLKKISSGEVND